jgi:CDP-paratose 2-epimerase
MRGRGPPAGMGVSEYGAADGYAAPSGIKAHLYKEVTQGMRLLVTGSSGLIGAAAVEFFCQLGCDVWGIDNNLRADFFGPAGDTRPMRNSLLAAHRRFVHVDADIRDCAAVEQLFGKGPFDAIIHAAAQPSHDLAALRPFEDFTVNANGTLNLLEAARQRSPGAVFCYMSSNKVYGDRPNRLPLVELDTRLDFATPEHRRGIDESFPVDQSLHSLFGVSKLAGDLLVQEYGRYFGLNTGVFRGGCLTGPGHAGVEMHGFLNHLVRCSVSRSQYTVFGYGGKQVRDQIHASDVISALWEFIKSPRAGGVYNIGGGRENAASLLECVTMIEERTERSPHLTFSDRPRIGDHMCYYTCLDRFKTDYPTWTLSYSLAQIVQEMCERALEADRRSAANA